MLVFPHEQTGYSLVKHRAFSDGRAFACRDCHDASAPGYAFGLPTCESCHRQVDAAFVDRHVAQYSADCFACHRQLEPFDHQVFPLTGRHAGVRCASCHAQQDFAQISAECIACHRDPEIHAGLFGKDCAACHTINGWLPARLSKHDFPLDHGSEGEIDCATCHTRIDRWTPPENHRQLWTQLHGACSRQGAEAATANDCSMCHRKDSCTECHQTQPPRDHTEYWRIQAHGMAAGIDRSRCQTCHASDSCDRCHQSTAPRSHTAGFNAPGNRHCAGCHVPLQTSGGCFVCHKSTPGHDSAPPKPAWHTPAMNCRSCHAASMKHLDNGDNCNACHR